MSKYSELAEFLDGIEGEFLSDTPTLREAATALRELEELLRAPQWKSVEKDNMEFAARITCYQMDAINAALAGRDE